MDYYNEKLGLNIPAHIAVILDGNGRWAKKRHMPRTYGHKVGSQVVEDMLYIVDEYGVKYFTVYAFSTENWKRSEEEVSILMSILRLYLKDCVKKSMKNNVRCRVIGKREGLSKDIIESICVLEETTKNNTGLNFTIAINYGGRDEITRAIKKIASQIEEGTMSASDITEQTINSNLDTCELPDPDLLIRTSGEERLSNYLPWQLAYTEFYFTDTLWPDFNEEELIKAFEKYNKRERRLAAYKEEISENQSDKRCSACSNYGFSPYIGGLVSICIMFWHCVDRFV